MKQCLNKIKKKYFKTNCANNAKLKEEIMFLIFQYVLEKISNINKELDILSSVQYKNFISLNKSTALTYLHPA